MRRLTPRNSERGVALVVVLLLVAIVAALVSEMVYESRIQMALAHNYQDHLRARYVAKAGFNIARGLLIHTTPFEVEGNRSLFQNDFINLFRCQCLSQVPEGELGQTEEQSREQAEKPPSELEGCGLWKLAINYPIEEDLLDLTLTDEQTRLNLNALVIPSVSEEGGAREDPQQVFRRVLRTLFLYQANRHQLTLTETDAEAILDYLVDWLDYGTSSDGGLDSDDTPTFEDGDRIYSNKNGPLDTVDELRMIPGMTDDLFNAVKDYLTVYPVKMQGQRQIFSSQVNLNLTSQEVLLALICGVGTPEGVCNFDDVMSQVLTIIQAGFGENGFLQNRNIPQNVPLLNNSTYLLANPPFRYYRIVSSGVTESGVVATITAVVKVPGAQQKVETLYWSED